MSVTWTKAWTIGGLVAASVMACEPRYRDVDYTQLRGWQLSEPIEKPEFTLTATNGEPYAFREETEGYLTLLFFGYTYCPDICPVHMANIAAVKRKLAPELARQIKVVFVSTDPDRDTPEHLRAWLDNFDAGFVGLRGTLDEVNAVQASMHLGASRIETLPDGDGYGVAHPATVIAFTRDNKAHVMYAFGTRQADWDHDLPLLLEE